MLYILFFQDAHLSMCDDGGDGEAVNSEGISNKKRPIPEKEGRQSKQQKRE